MSRFQTIQISDNWDLPFGCFKVPISDRKSVLNWDTFDPISDSSDFRQLGPHIWMLYSPDFRQKKSVCYRDYYLGMGQILRAPKFERPDFRHSLYSGMPKSERSDFRQRQNPNILVFELAVFGFRTFGSFERSDFGQIINVHM